MGTSVCAGAGAVGAEGGHPSQMGVPGTFSGRCAVARAVENRPGMQGPHRNVGVVPGRRRYRAGPCATGQCAAIPHPDRTARPESRGPPLRRLEPAGADRAVATGPGPETTERRPYSPTNRNGKSAFSGEGNLRLPAGAVREHKSGFQLPWRNRQTCGTGGARGRGRLSRAPQKRAIPWTHTWPTRSSPSWPCWPW